MFFAIILKAIMVVRFLQLKRVTENMYAGDGERREGER